MAKEIDYRIYATVHLTDRDLQIYLTNFGNFLATPVNILAFYLIIQHSKREQKLFKYTLFTSHFFFYISNLFYGSLANLVILFPFPGVVSIGFLKDWIDGFWSCFIWICLFAIFVFSTFSLLLVRLRIVARKGRVFDFSDRTYLLLCCFLFAYIFLPVCGMWINSYHTKDEQVDYITKYFPNNLIAFENPSIHVDIGELNQKILVFLLLIILISGLLIYSSLYIIVVYEISKQTILKSTKTTKSHRKVVNSMLFQIVILGNAVFFSLVLQIRHAFVEPEVDTRVTTALANATLVTSSIPCQLFMILSTSHYRHVLFKIGGVSIETTMEHRPSTIFLKGRSKSMTI